MLLTFLTTILNRSVEVQPEKKPWEKDNSWLVPVGIKPEIKVSQVYYKDMYNSESISTGISDISILVTKV